jgi:acyl dehydratase
MSAPSLEDLAVGQEVGSRTIVVARQDLVRYAGVSGDLNPIHWSDEFATGVGLPGVIAHGMFTMGSSVNVVTDWVGDPGRILEYGVRFTRPVPVPASGSALIEVVAVVGSMNPGAGTARIDLTATADGARVLGKAQVVVRLD